MRRKDKEGREYMVTWNSMEGLAPDFVLHMENANDKRLLLPKKKRLLTINKTNYYHYIKHPKGGPAVHT